MPAIGALAETTTQSEQSTLSFELLVVLASAAESTLIVAACLRAIVCLHMGANCASCSDRHV